MSIIDTVKDQFSGDDSFTDDELPWNTQPQEDNSSHNSSNVVGRISGFKLSNLSTKQKAIAGIIVFCLLMCGFVAYNYLSTSHSVSLDTSASAASSETETTSKQVRVYVSGCVVAPGVYTCNADMRVIDAVNMAGGFTADANTDSINLAQNLTDGEQISIPSKTVSSTSTDSSSSSSSSSSSGTDSSGKININTADLTTLQKLSGVGPSTAQKIIDYRNANGKFKTIEDIKNVSGIGDKTYAKFSSQICV